MDASGAQGAYDSFLGKVSSTGADMMLMIWYSPLEAGTTALPYQWDIVADGVPFVTSPAPETEGGGTTFFAKGIKGRNVWTLMADTANTREAWVFFRQVVSTFRFPSPTFVEPTPKPSPS